MAKIKKMLLGMGVVSMACVCYFSVSGEYVGQRHDADLLLQDVEALADGEDDKTKCSNETFIPDEALRPATCWNGGTHKKCKDEKEVCCDPSQQTDCDPILGGGGKK